MTLKLTTSPEGYILSILTEPSCQLRMYFDSLPGTIKMRTVNLPKGYSSLNLFQIKNDRAGNVSIFTEELSLNQDISSAVEEFLRKMARDIPAGKDERPPQEFLHYYETPFSLVGCTLKVSDLGIVSLDIDYQANTTLRMVNPEFIEQKLSALEMSAPYTAEIKIRKLGMKDSEIELLCHEYKQECGHILFERKS